MPGPSQCSEVHWTVLSGQTDPLYLRVHPRWNSQRDHHKNSKWGEVPWSPLVQCHSIYWSLYHVAVGQGLSLAYTSELCQRHCGWNGEIGYITPWCTLYMKLLITTLWNNHHEHLCQAYLHSMNVIHRDLNSYNCLVREVNNGHLWFNNAYTQKTMTQKHHLGQEIKRQNSFFTCLFL